MRFPAIGPQSEDGARGEQSRVPIVNFAKGSLEVHEDRAHLMVGPSHRTDRPALASQDEIGSREGRTGAVRPSSRRSASEARPKSLGSNVKQMEKGPTGASFSSALPALRPGNKIPFSGRNKSSLAAFLNCLLSPGPAARRKSQDEIRTEKGRTGVAGAALLIGRTNPTPGPTPSTSARAPLAEAQTCWA